MTDPKPFQFEISLSVLNHLGRNLYRNFITVLGEAISNAWDADAKTVWISVDKNSSRFSIKDDGTGMSSDDFQNKFLKIGYSKRSKGSDLSSNKRPFIGAKGIGKLALLSCAQRISVFSKKNGEEYIGGVIDNSGLDQAITNDLTPEQYPLEALDSSLITELSAGHSHGTIIIFEGVNEQIKSSDVHLRKLLAMTFRFALIDKNFRIFLNDVPVSLNDLKNLTEKTQFVWNINEHKDDFLSAMTALKETPITLSTPIGITGFLATVEKPRDLKVSGSDTRATVDLFVNGRLREKNILRHIPTQRIVESYLYGQIHFDALDRVSEGGQYTDPFTSSREGVLEDNAQFKSLLDYLRREAIPKVIDQWDALRLKNKDSGDDENPRKTKKTRKALELFSVTSDDYSGTKGSAADEQVKSWLGELEDDAAFNIEAYSDCFVAENLVRRYIAETGLPPIRNMEGEVNKWRTREGDAKNSANISFKIRDDESDIAYLGMDWLAAVAEGSREKNPKKASLHFDAIRYAPIRNAVGHTGRLSKIAKNDLNVTYENVKARIRNLLSLK